MGRPLLRASWIALALLIAAVAQAKAADPCQDVFDKLDAAMTVRDEASLGRLGAAANDVPGCDADRRTRYRRSAARLLAELSKDAGAETATRLATARRVYPVWEVTRGLADLAFARRDYATAGQLYGLALNDMLRRFPADPPVAAQDVLLVQRRAGEVDMLAPTIPAPMRDGLPGGLDAVLLPGGARDLGVQPRLLPVTFEYSRAAMTTEGAAFADRWQTSLQAAAIPALVLAGHTDPTGDAALNETLAVRRAAALADQLRRGGFQGAIAVVGFGSRCPISFTAPYSEAEQHQILRRVEVFRGGEVPTGRCPGQNPRQG